MIANLETLNVSLADGVATVELNRPDKSNAMSAQMWLDIGAAFRAVDQTPAARVAILAARGSNFTAGIDLTMLAGVRERIRDDCEGRMREKLRRLILDLQDALCAIERCRKPVLAAIHGACYGGGIDMVTCCDMRYASADARFCVKEIDVGMTADVGTLQRLPKLVPDGIARELAYTGRTFGAAEAREMGLLNRVFDTPESLRQGVAEVASTIAAKSPLSIRGIKEMALHARDHPVADGLNHVATWNAAMLLSADLHEAMAARQEQRAPTFRD